MNDTLAFEPIRVLSCGGEQHLISGQALAAVGLMMAAFGHNETDIAKSEVACIAAQVWSQSRTASFERKLDQAARELTQNRCADPDVEQGVMVEFNHRREAGAWDDAVLATLTALRTARAADQPAPDALSPDALSPDALARDSRQRMRPAAWSRAIPLGKITPVSLIMASAVTIDMPMAVAMPQAPAELVKLPSAQPVKLSTSFKIAMPAIPIATEALARGAVHSGLELDQLSDAHEGAPIIPSVDSELARADLIASGNLLDFWQTTPVMGMAVEPTIDLLQMAAIARRD